MRNVPERRVREACCAVGRVRLGPLRRPAIGTFRSGPANRRRVCGSGEEWAAGCPLRMRWRLEDNRQKD